MSSAALKQDALLPRSPGGNGPGAALALVVHAGLLAALTLGIDWRMREPEVVSAELWAAVPQSAAPPPAPPPAPTPAPTPAPAPEVSLPSPPLPPPVAREAALPDADIALEQERQRKVEADRKKAERDAARAAEQAAERQAEINRKRAAADKKAEDERLKRELAEAKREAQREAARLAQEKADDARLARQREENLLRMMGQAGGTAGATAPAGTAAQSAAPSAGYAGKVKAAVRPNIVFTGILAASAAAEVEVTAAPGGSIISRRLSRSSGNKDWDEAVLRAIDKTRAMPRDADGRVPPSLLLSFRPNE